MDDKENKTENEQAEMDTTSGNAAALGATGTVDYEFGVGDVVIDPYSSDLNLVVDKECLLAYPVTYTSGLCSMWAGCRATYGVSRGRAAFEVHLEDYCECTDLPKDDAEPYLLRVGWSLREWRSSFPLLGESDMSYAYCSTGKICTNKEFKDYGDVFDKGDSIGCYIDFESDSDYILMSFSKNGLDQGEAYKVKKRNLLVDTEPQIFFPHVLSRNMVFEMNFGQRVSIIGEEPFAPIKSGFDLMQKIPLDSRHPGEDLEKHSSDKKDYEVVLVVGLPGSGKTTWSLKECETNSDKNYYVIGVASVLDKMRMLGLKKKPAPTSELTLINSLNRDCSASKLPNDLLEKALKCVNILTQTASQSLRNVILDQSNTYGSNQRRKLNLFEGYKRRVVVIIPADDEYKRRLSSIMKQDGQDIQPSLIYDMKINFRLPSNNECESIEYIELNKQDAESLIEVYKKESTADRLKLLVDNRMKKNQEKRKNCQLNPAAFIRPVFRPSLVTQQLNSVAATINRFGPPTMYRRPNMYQQPVGYVMPPGQASMWPLPQQHHAAFPPAMSPTGTTIYYPQAQFQQQQQQSQNTQSNSWDPVMSTSLSHSIAYTSAFSTNISNNNNNNSGFR